MRSDILLLAGLAGSALALPATSTQLDTRTFGLVGGLLDTVNDLLGGTSPVSLLEGISSEAAAALGGCALGVQAGSIHIQYRRELSIWLESDSGSHLDGSLRKSLLAWCQSDAPVDLVISPDNLAQLSFFIPTCANIAAKKELFVSLDGIFSFAQEVVGVLTVTAQGALEKALSLIGEVDWEVRSALEFCAAGGIVKDLDVGLVNALKAWLMGGECPLSAELHKTVLSWVEGKIEGEVIHLPSLPVGGLTAISIGKSLESLIVEATGALVGSAQTALSALLGSNLGLEIEGEIKEILAFIAGGGLAIELEYVKRAALSAWLASSKCQLTAELKGLVVLWLSFGVSPGSEVSIGISTGIIGELTGFLTGTIDALLGTNLHGLISFILSGKGVLSISLEARAQLAALIGGGFGLEIDESILTIIIGWLSGCHECCGSHPPTTGLPTSTAIPTISIPTISTTATETDTPTPTPTGVEPTETPSETPSETPCETITSESTTSYTVSETEAPTPTGVEPTETPCETITTESTTSYTVSETETPVPTEVEPTETGSETPCETITTESIISHTISHPPSITEAPVPTTTSKPKKTVTITTTVGVAYCPPN
ncbi:putative cell wall protein [Aspergillus lucknowensis]|uniref:Cell wall protein n=1 Tax=Aspergillus lucknowensis TaxID=176173 RepID=A0ABR4LRG3_9EURO